MRPLNPPLEYLHGLHDLLLNGLDPLDFTVHTNFAVLPGMNIHRPKELVFLLKL